VQALQATTWGETPVNRLACSYMNKLVRGSCAKYHANEPEAYYASIKFWKTPLADCGNGKKVCMDYSAWIKAWNQVIS
jgi:putative spermidine/putrescine transport system substrate-binding protein